MMWSNLSRDLFGPYVTWATMVVWPGNFSYNFFFVMGGALRPFGQHVGGLHPSLVCSWWFRKMRCSLRGCAIQPPMWWGRSATFIVQAFLGTLAYRSAIMYLTPLCVLTIYFRLCCPPVPAFIRRFALRPRRNCT